MIIAATAMAGVVIASSSDVEVNPINRSCTGLSQAACGTLIGFNNGNEFGYLCEFGLIVAYEACMGNTKCQVTSQTTYACF
ncbi:hypothetical protein EDB19DRAFT_1768210 [Suillus lakei]|nr:hypothetical protein EDB19DRAFT_1775237 [Suillus lakei]KAG1722354.1 hypothetical protein EDB19DRAFT_1768210 [Suillus lakei]